MLHKFNHGTVDDEEFICIPTVFLKKDQVGQNAELIGSWEVPNLRRLGPTTQADKQAVTTQILLGINNSFRNKWMIELEVYEYWLGQSQEIGR